MSQQDNPFLPSSGVIAQPRQQLQWPHPVDLDVSAPRRQYALFSRAPWFYPNGLADANVIRQYVSAGFLPDGIPVSALDTPDWKLRCCAPTNALTRSWLRAQRRKATAQETRIIFTQKIYKREFRYFEPQWVDEDLHFDTWVYRSAVEARRGPSLRRVYDSPHALSFGLVDQRAIFHTRPVLPAEFRYISRRDPAYEGKKYLEYLRFERSLRGKYGYLVPYQCLEFVEFHASSRATRYLPVPKDWVEWEVPLGLAVELPSVLTYMEQRLRESSDVAWPIFYTEWTVNCAASLLWEAYSTHRLFWIPPYVRRGIRHLNLTWLLGSKRNADELLELVALIERIRWPDVNFQNRKRKVPPARDVSATLRRDGGGDWVWYDPWNRKQLNMQEIMALREQERRHMPINHPTGYVALEADGQLVGAPNKGVSDADLAAKGGLPVSMDADSESHGANSADESTERAGTEQLESTAVPSPGDPIPRLDLGKGLRTLSSDAAASPRGDGASRADAPSGPIDTEDAKVQFLQTILRAAGCSQSVDSVDDVIAQLATAYGKRPREGVAGTPPKTRKLTIGSSSASPSATAAAPASASRDAGASASGDARPSVAVNAPSAPVPVASLPVPMDLSDDNPREAAKMKELLSTARAIPLPASPSSSDVGEYQEE